MMLMLLLKIARQYVVVFTNIASASGNLSKLIYVLFEHGKQSVLIIKE